MKWGRVSLFVVMAMLQLSLTASLLLLRVESYQYPSYPFSVNSTTWFLEMFDNLRPVIHSMLNRTSWYLEGWNITGAHWPQHEFRTSLAHYSLACVLAYEKTNNDTYLYEAKWLMNNYIAHEGESTPNYAQTWRIYRYSSRHGYAIHDVWLWIAMAKLNEYGCSYNVTGRVDEAINVAYYSNSTDLGWEYSYYEQTGRATNYIVNSFAHFVFIMGYLTNAGVKDYTDEINRTYTSMERFRLGNGQYKYAICDSAASDMPHMMAVVGSLLFGEKYTPSIFNNTKIQKTLDSFTYEGLYDVLRSGALVFLMEEQSFAISDQWKRVLRLTCEKTLDCFQEKFEAGESWTIKRSKWTIMNELTKHMMYSGLVSETVVTLPAITDQMPFPGAHYSSAVLKNDSIGYVYWTNTHLEYPVLGLAESRTHVAPSQGLVNPIPFNTTTNSFHVDNWSYDKQNLTLDYGKFVDNCNFTADGAVSWRSYNLPEYFDDYEHHIINSNGTVVPLKNENKTWKVTLAWALESRTSSKDATYYIFKTDNTSLTQFVWSQSAANDSLYLLNVITEWSMWRIEERIDLDANSLIYVRSLIANACARIENNQKLIPQETIDPKVSGKIIHSDANISNYVDTIASNNRLTFTLSYRSGETSRTYAYVGKEGKPVAVIGATSWSYNGETKIVTIDVFHFGAEEIIMVFGEHIPPTTTINVSGVLGNNDWFVSEVMVSLSATSDISGVNKTEFSFDNATWITYITPFTITNEGYIIVYYRSIDKADNLEATKIETIKIDRTPPTIWIFSPREDAEIKSSSLPVEWNSIDATSEMDYYEIRLDNASWIVTGTDTTYTFTQLGDGSHIVEVRAFDNAGNRQTISIGFIVNTSSFSGLGYVEKLAIIGTAAILTALAVTVYLLKIRNKSAGVSQNDVIGATGRTLASKHLNCLSLKWFHQN